MVVSTCKGVRITEFLVVVLTCKGDQCQSYFTVGSLPPNSSTWRQALETNDQHSFFQMNTCGYSPYLTSSLTRRCSCCLQRLMAIDSADILRSESRGTDDHILLSQIRDSPNLEGQVPVFSLPRFL
jgi:hypothetical protein